MLWWRKKLLKTADVAFTIPIGSPVWATANHEPLICVVCFPLSECRTDLGSFGTVPLVSDYKGNCQKYLRAMSRMQGIYCANAWSKRGHFLPCDVVSHGGCFVASGRFNFQFEYRLTKQVIVP
jgi:hypothetical protein